ncbi:MAG: hypothetical protein A2144_11075 [Chloroflexi bacterium RBG_16_50_9]|nr:MAG: hypothetical protein A2144_11075 [Chloroflexi bacterium RBG_16_50_9]
MKSLRLVVPAIVTILLTILAIFSAMWLTGLVPPGSWSELIKATIVIFIIGSALVLIAWSAYFTYIIRDTVDKLVSR